VDPSDFEQVREIMRRSDQRFAQMVARWDKREDRRHKEAMARIEQLKVQSDELIESSRASRQALLKILDRMDNGGPAPAT
jgi:hypothetical protein